MKKSCQEARALGLLVEYDQLFPGLAVQFASRKNIPVIHCIRKTDKI